MLVAADKPCARKGLLSNEELARNLARAREQDAKIAAVARKRRQMTAELAYLLRAFDDEQLYRALEYSDIGVYAVRRGYLDSERLAHDLVRAVRKLDDFPRLKEVFRSGEAFVSKVLRVLPHVTKANEAELATAVKQLTSRQLEAKLRGMEGLATPFRDEERRTFGFTREGAAFVDQRIQAEIRAARELGIVLTPSEAAERIFRGSHLESAATNRMPPWRMVIHACECGSKAWIQTREGLVPVSPETLNEAASDAVVADVTNGPMDVTNTIPPRIRDYVYDRDQGRCRAPGCKNMGYLHVHHEPGRKVVGHDPEYMLLACTRHHPDRHAGRIYIRGSHSTGFRWFLFDGTELPADPDAPGCVPPLPRRVLAADLLLARAALRRMRLKRRDADQLIECARASLEERGEAVTVEALVNEARRLRSAPLESAAPSDAGQPEAAEQAPEERASPAVSAPEPTPADGPVPEPPSTTALTSHEASAPAPAPAQPAAATSDEPPARAATQEAPPSPASAHDGPQPVTAPPLEQTPPSAPGFPDRAPPTDQPQPALDQALTPGPALSERAPPAPRPALDGSASTAAPARSTSRRRRCRTGGPGRR